MSKCTELSWRVFRPTSKFQNEVLCKTFCPMPWLTTDTAALTEIQNEGGRVGDCRKAPKGQLDNAMRSGKDSVEKHREFQRQASSPMCLPRAMINSFLDWGNLSFRLTTAALKISFHVDLVHKVGYKILSSV